MTSALKLRKKPARIMEVGFPGSGKTGSLACLANAGYKLRILDFDGNLEPLILNTKEQFLQNIDAVYLEDKMRVSAAGGTEPAGIPQAYLNALKMMDHWTYEEDGQIIDLGKSKDWGDDTIVVLDSLTALGNACFRRAMKLLNKTALTVTDRMWGFAMAEQEAFIERLASESNKHHVIVLAHLKMIAPRDVRQGDSDLTKELKSRQADLIGTRYYPSALGWQLPQQIAAHFPSVILVEPEYKGTSASRKLKMLPRPELDLKVPAPNLPKELDIETGMLEIFKALGHTPPINVT